MPGIALKKYKGIEVERMACVDSARNAALQEAVLDRLLEVNEIEVPPDLVENEAARMLLELRHRMTYETLATGNTIRLTSDEMAEQMTLIHAQADKQVKTDLILDAIIDAERFEVTTAELDEEALAIANRQKISIEMVKDFLGEDLAPLKKDLLVRKAIELVTTSAVIH